MCESSSDLKMLRLDGGIWGISSQEIWATWLLWEMGTVVHLLHFFECLNIIEIVENLNPVTTVAVQIDVALELNFKESAEVAQLKAALSTWKKVVLNNLKMYMYLHVYLCMFKTLHHQKIVYGVSERLI